MQKQNSRKASAEAQNSKAASEEDFSGLVNVVKYIKEREENLARYSTALRANLAKIAELFGEGCKVCNRSEAVGAHEQTFQGQGQYAGSTFAEDKKKYHKYAPKIQVSITVEDEQYFRREDDDGMNADTYWLVLMPPAGRRYNYGGLLVKMVTNGCEEQASYQTFKDECSRATLKALVKSGRLPKFLALVTEKLEKTASDYKQVAEVAEKMAKAIEPADIVQHANATLKREGAEEVGQ